MTARFHALMQPRDIGFAISRIDQKVERSAIVPDVEGLRRLPLGGIGRDPLHGGGIGAETVSR